MATVGTSPSPRLNTSEILKFYIHCLKRFSYPFCSLVWTINIFVSEPLWDLKFIDYSFLTHQLASSCPPFPMWIIIQKLNHSFVPRFIVPQPQSPPPKMDERGMQHKMCRSVSFIVNGVQLALTIACRPCSVFLIRLPVLSRITIPTLPAFHKLPTP